MVGLGCVFESIHLIRDIRSVRFHLLSPLSWTFKNCDTVAHLSCSHHGIMMAHHHGIDCLL